MGLVIGQTAESQTGSEALVKKDQHWTRQTQFSRTFIVIAVDLAETEQDIIRSIGIPPLTSTLGLTGAKCKAVRGAEMGNVIRHPVTGVPTVLWHVTCDFDTDLDVDEAEQSPESRTPKIRWGGENEEQRLEEDALSSAPVQTVPGDILIVKAPEVRPILEVKRFEVFPFDPLVQLNFANHVNSLAFYGAPIGTALMMPITVQEVNIDEFGKFNDVTYRIKFKLKELIAGPPPTFKLFTWRANVLHHGFKFFTDENFATWIASTPTDPTDVAEWLAFVKFSSFEPKLFQKDGNPATVNLDKFGLIEPSPLPADASFLEFSRFPLADFNTLGLGPFG